MRQSRFIAIALVAMCGLALGAAVHAAGAGGGGSVPACTEDVWNCTGFGPCSESGTQTRTCQLTSDCATANTPKPNESQRCTPPAPEPTPEPVAAPAPEEPQELPAPTSEPAPQAAPAEAQPPAEVAPACTQDVWECGAWKHCDADGNSQRDCSVTFDCPGVDTPAPEFTKRCETLQCGDLPTMRQRVYCRLQLNPAGLEQEYGHQYIPEECHMYINDEATVNKCINRYKWYKPCWYIPVGPERLACAREKNKISADIPAEKQACQAKATPEEQASCMAELKEKVYNVIKFRFYDLEERAEELMERGADINHVADFVTLVGTKKQEFNNAKTKEARKQIILDIRQGWHAFVLKVKDDVK